MVTTEQIMKEGKTLTEKLVTKHGVEVVDGKIAVGDFARNFNTRIGDNSYFEGSWDELRDMVEAHWEDNEPGAGSVDGDVLLINLPPAGFHSSVAEITDANREHVITVEEPRKEGEKPVVTRHIVGEKPEANFVQVVVYRADVLAQDDDRSTDAEWEIIAILANIDKVTPMSPTTMERNANHDEGGTYREYSEKEWADAYAYWSTHVSVKTEA